MFELNNYKTIIFDCDGVILNSNRIKTDAFYHVALPYGEKAANELVDYHLKNGGVSRYSKFEHFQRDILIQPFNSNMHDALLEAFSFEVKKGLLACDIAEGLGELRNVTEDCRWMVVSGSDQGELRNVFTHRKIDHLFDGKIFGSPDDKDTILTRELSLGNIIFPAVFLGDAKYDMEAALRADLDFVFVSEWSECKNMDAEDTNLFSIRQLSDLL